MTQSAISLIESDRPKKWQEILSDLITDPKELVQVLQLDLAAQPVSLAAMQQFPLKVTKPFVASMEIGNWNDPLLRQVWPARDEEANVPGYVDDPLKESAANPVAGLLHKYQGRVLLTAVPHCAIHCRYCFRRHFDYDGNSPSRIQWRQTLNYIAGDQSISEVILSGGDPLAASDQHLGWLISKIEEIPHVETLRIHSRLPIVLPQRLNPELLSLLENSRLNMVLVLHCNHPQEISDEVQHFMGKIDANSITLLNQSVLLAEINDNSTTLAELSHSLFALNVLPYYLHLPDKVAGTAHFSVSREKALQIIRQMENQLSGYLVPRLVQEEAGLPAKSRLR
ncbi:MAG: EF-P beta-lysylation protein EpmB [Pseudomonadales bacterium]|nr:EF-P beta-lysylation protein EpmB [Pseudomonadales bacterium]